MEIPETPKTVEKLDLMLRLHDYSTGKASWKGPRKAAGPDEQRACRALYNDICRLVNTVLAPLLDRVTTREMEQFTLHDRVHGRKVAHLMWNILSPGARNRLTPPEIGMLVSAAHIHDLGMGLSAAERARRLDLSSDLWQRMEVDPEVQAGLERLRQEIRKRKSSKASRLRAARELFQAEEVVLCKDTRERHATRQRYEQLLDELRSFHRRSPERIPDIDSLLAYDGISYRDRLVDICVSHNEMADVLVEPDENNPARPRFTRSSPVGGCNVDLQMIAASLRMADILDFDRERTPSVLFFYLLPAGQPAEESRSLLEWGKHTSISNWQIKKEEIVFRGTCTDHVIHHTIVKFCKEIEHEIRATRAALDPLQEGRWPFVLPSTVTAEIEEQGYRYIPYRFELEDAQVYKLLMGGAIYRDRLVALRELLQNAVDACRLRDAQSRLHDSVTPEARDRISVIYEEPLNKDLSPSLTVTDSGTGMDAWLLEQCFLKVGRSYYRTSEFNNLRIQLRKAGLDFAPVSEFGIGFLSCFLLANRVWVETALWESPSGDTRRRILQIDGPTRLIRLQEFANQGPGRFKGTRVKLELGASADGEPLAWEKIKKYLRNVCVELPYRLTLVHRSGGKEATEYLDATAGEVEIPDELKSFTIRIPVADKAAGLRGEIFIANPHELRTKETEKARKGLTTPNSELWQQSTLIRGGFRIGAVPGLPSSFASNAVSARLTLTWEGSADHRYLLTDLSRSRIADEKRLSTEVVRIWLSYLLDNTQALTEGQLYALSLQGVRLHDCRWLRKYSLYDLYMLGRFGWAFALRERGGEEALKKWESGQGGSLRLGSGTFDDEVFRQLLDIVLPAVSTLQMGEHDVFHVTAPRNALPEGLKSSPWPRDPSWGIFAEFVGSIENDLAYEYPNSFYFNSRFRDRLKEFDEAELAPLLGVCHKLADARGSGRRSILSPAEVTLLRKAQAIVGDLSISELNGRWKLGSFQLA